MSQQFGVGSTVWIFDINRRVYRKGTGIGGGPVWRDHWRPEKIASETSRSWVTEYGLKIPKKGADARCVAFSEEEVERAAYVHDNAYRIGDRVGNLRDYELLRQIATLISYEPKS